MDIIKLEPVFKEMIWGGDRLKSDFDYDIPSMHTGECWGIGAHPNGDCIVANGEYKGTTLSTLWENHRELFGGIKGDKFPLLIKIIDAKKDLSIQVHPDDKYAKEHENGSLGKTECWYILDCEKDAGIVIGHNAKDHDELCDMINNKRWDEFIRNQPIKKGDFFQIDPGCLHAIKKGTMILETQQNSDITYRVYDYDRLSDGKPRALHVKESMDVITAPYKKKEVTRQTLECGDATIDELVSNEFYTVKKVKVKGNSRFIQDTPFTNVSVIEGKGKINGTDIKKGDHFIIPSGFGQYSISGDLEYIESYV